MPEPYIPEAHGSAKISDMFLDCGLEQVCCGADVDRDIPEGSQLRGFLYGKARFDFSGVFRTDWRFRLTPKIVFKPFSHLLRQRFLRFHVDLTRPLPHFSGRFSVLVFERFVEQAHIGKTVVIDNAGDGDFGVQQILHRVAEPDFGQVIAKGHAVGFSEKAGQVPGGQVQLFRQILQADRGVVIRLDIVFNHGDARVKFRVLILRGGTTDQEPRANEVQNLIAERDVREVRGVSPVGQVVAEQLLQHDRQRLIRVVFVARGIAPENNVPKVHYVGDHIVLDHQLQIENVLCPL